MVDSIKIQEITEAAARRIKGGAEFTAAVRAAMRGKGVREEKWGEYFSAVAAELGKRGRDMQPRKPEPPKPAAEGTAEPQLGFGFGEGHRVKTRLDRRRHL